MSCERCLFVGRMAFRGVGRDVGEGVGWSWMDGRAGCGQCIAAMAVLCAGQDGGWRMAAVGHKALNLSLKPTQY